MATALRSMCSPGLSWERRDLNGRDEADSRERLARLDVQILFPALVLVDARRHRLASRKVDLVLAHELGAVALGPVPRQLLDVRVQA
jgi:hypothetical protein